MHIGIVIPRLHGGGAESIARKWITELRSRDHIVTVYVYDREQISVDLPPEVIVRRFMPHFWKMRTVLLPVWLRRTISSDHPDVVVSFLTYGNVATLLALTLFSRRPIPLLVSEHNVQSVLLVATRRRRDRVVLWLARRLYRRAAAVLAVSHPVAGDLVSAFRVAPDRIFVIPTPAVSSIVRQRATPDCLHVALVGRLADQKRPNLLVPVLLELQQRDINVRTTVIGDGPLRIQTEEESLQSGLNISFVGWQEPWWEATSKIDCVLVTAHVEGFNLVLVEAAAAGIPCVASSRALGVADAIVPGITGELALTDSPSDYADAVVRAASPTLSSEGLLDGWLEHFSTGHSTTALLAAIRSVEGNTEN
jgi:glycosyltransferase involved in cell wall biosynthesis